MVTLCLYLYKGRESSVWCASDRRQEEMDSIPESVSRHVNTCVVSRRTTYKRKRWQERARLAVSLRKAEQCMMGMLKVRWYCAGSRLGKKEVGACVVAYGRGESGSEQFFQWVLLTLSQTNLGRMI